MGRDVGAMSVSTGSFADTLYPASDRIVVMAAPVRTLRTPPIPRRDRRVNETVVATGDASDNFRVERVVDNEIDTILDELLISVTIRFSYTR